MAYIIGTPDKTRRSFTINNLKYIPVLNNVNKIMVCAHIIAHLRASYVSFFYLFVKLM